MSSFKKVDGLLDSLQKQAVGAKTIEGAPIEDFLSIAGYEEPAGGGGGSSDFSTAEVKIINDTASEVTIDNCPIVDEGELSGGISLSANTESTLTLILYKGHTYIYAISVGGTPMVDGTGITVTGDIVNESDEYEVYIIISGNGTITIS